MNQSSFFGRQRRILKYLPFRMILSRFKYSLNCILERQTRNIFALILVFISFGPKLTLPFTSTLLARSPTKLCCHRQSRSSPVSLFHFEQTNRAELLVRSDQSRGPMDFWVCASFAQRGIGLGHVVEFALARDLLSRVKSRRRAQEFQGRRRIGSLSRGRVQVQTTRSRDRVSYHVGSHAQWRSTGLYLPHSFGAWTAQHP